MPYRRIRDPDQLQALLGAVLEIEADIELAAVLRRIVEVACSLAQARYGALGVLDEFGTTLAEFVTVGVEPEDAHLIGQFPQGVGVLGRLILDAEPLRIADLSLHPDAVGFPPGHPVMRSFLGVPVRIRERVYGNLYLTEKRGAEEFSQGDENLITALANAAAITIDNARLHDRVSNLSVTEDRERIARDLHDTVIQRLFAVGLGLRSSLSLAESPVLKSRIESAIGDLDTTVRQVRTTIFGLEPLPSADRGVRARVLEVCEEAERSLAFEPEVRFSGPIDTRVTDQTAIQLLSTIREALSNVARHASAHRTEVEVRVEDGRLSLLVRDDGVGIDPRSHAAGDGLANMAQRAETLGGSFFLRACPEGGTEVAWTVPLP